MCQIVRLYSVVEIVVMSGEVSCCSVVCGTLVGVSVFSVMCSELLIMSEISWVLCTRFFSSSILFLMPFMLI